MIIASCRPDIKESAGTLKYFDIKGFFHADSARLSHKNPLVTKTVSHNRVVQTKKVHINNWGTELAPFIDADINKPAWRDSYALQTGKGLLIYVAKTPELKTRQIIIKQLAGKVIWIQVYNNTKNLLYEDIELLTYFPDSLYSITKSQKVRFMGKNTYVIKGFFN